MHPGLEHVILAHLSETNNTPQMALAEAGRVLSGSHVRLTAAAQGSPDPAAAPRLTPRSRTAPAFAPGG